MRRSLARRAIAFTSASVGRRRVSRSVSRTQGHASRKVGVGISCNMLGSISAKKKGGRYPASPFGALVSPAGSSGSGGLICVHRLFGSVRHREYRDERTTVGFSLKFHTTLDLGEESVVRTHADIKAGVPRGAALTRDNVAGNHMLAAIDLDAKALALGI